MKWYEVLFLALVFVLIGYVAMNYIGRYEKVKEVEEKKEEEPTNRMGQLRLEGATEITQIGRAPGWYVYKKNDTYYEEKNGTSIEITMGEYASIIEQSKVM